MKRYGEQSARENCQRKVSQIRKFAPSSKKCPESRLQSHAALRNGGVTPQPQGARPRYLVRVLASAGLDHLRLESLVQLHLRGRASPGGRRLRDLEKHGERASMTRTP